MEPRRSLPASLSGTATPERTDATPEASLVRARGDELPGPNHNLISGEQVDLLRSSVRSIRELQRQIDQLNGRKNSVYDTLRRSKVDPGIVKKLVYRLGQPLEQIEAMQLRDAKLSAYWRAIEDMVDGEMPPATSADGNPEA